MNKQQVEIAVATGLELLGEKSEIAIPAKNIDGAFLLKQLLMAIAQGQLGLTPTVQAPPAGDPPPKPNPTPRGPRKTKK